MYLDSKGVNLRDMPKIGIRGHPYKAKMARLGNDTDYIDKAAWLWKVDEGRGCDKITLVAAIIKSVFVAKEP